LIKTKQIVIERNIKTLIPKLLFQSIQIQFHLLPHRDSSLFFTYQFLFFGWILESDEKMGAATQIRKRVAATQIKVLLQILPLSFLPSKRKCQVEAKEERRWWWGCEELTMVLWISVLVVWGDGADVVVVVLMLCAVRGGEGGGWQRWCYIGGGGAVLELKFSGFKI
jgi:hypothetical protein